MSDADAHIWQHTAHSHGQAPTQHDFGALLDLNALDLDLAMAAYHDSHESQQFLSLTSTEGVCDYDLSRSDLLDASLFLQTQQQHAPQQGTPQQVYHQACHQAYQHACQYRPAVPPTPNSVEMHGQQLQEDSHQVLVDQFYAMPQDDMVGDRP